LPAGSSAISLPFRDVGDRALYAQAQSGMRFRLVDAWIQDAPRPYRRLVASMERLVGNATSHGARSRAVALERDLQSVGIWYVIVWNREYAVTHLLAVLHLTPQRVDGIVVYRLPGRATAGRG
jgi:hypothetical protein